MRLWPSGLRNKFEEAVAVCARWGFFTRGGLVLVLAMTTFALFMGPGPSPVQKTFAAEKEVELIENQVGAVREVVRENVKLVPPRREPEEGKTEFVVMPIPVANPTVGAGLAAVGMFLYKASENAPTSNTTVGGLYTNNDTWAVAVSQKTYLDGDRFRLNGIAGYGNINLDFAGIGSESGKQGVTVPITEKGYMFMPDFLYRFATHFYGGVRYRYLDFKTVVDPQYITVGGQPIFPDVDFASQSRIRSSGLGLVMNYDSRDNGFYPYRGTFFDANAVFAAKALGSDVDYQVYQGAYNIYFTIAEKMTLAYRFYGRFTAGEVPLYDLSYFGAHNDLRGYAAGEFVDQMMLATQLEFRWRFWKRWGMVAFGGVGKVGRDLNDLDSRDLLPSAGVGLRFVASEKERVNLSIDYARGREGDAVYFYIGEAF